MLWFIANITQIYVALFHMIFSNELVLLVQIYIIQLDWEMRMKAEKRKLDASEEEARQQFNL